jgi:hypothetical protein
MTVNRNYLWSSGAAAARIPYCAAMVDSDLFHETDILDFRPGYTSRRINITLLYGMRDPAREPR